MAYLPKLNPSVAGGLGGLPERFEAPAEDDPDRSDVGFTPIFSGASELSASGSRDWSGVCASRCGQHIYACETTGYIYVSNDYGASFTQYDVLPSSSFAGYGGIRCTDDGKDVVVCSGSERRVYRSEDYGASFALLPSGGAFTNPNGRHLYAVSADLNYIYAQGARSLDGGNSWNTSPVLGYSNIRILCSDDGKYVLTDVNQVQGYSAYYSSDFGANFAIYNPSSVTNSNIDEVALSGDGKGIFIGYEGSVNGSFTSDNNGSTFSAETLVRLSPSSSRATQISRGVLCQFYYPEKCLISASSDIITGVRYFNLKNIPGAESLSSASSAFCVGDYFLIRAGSGENIFRFDYTEG